MYTKGVEKKEVTNKGVKTFLVQTINLSASKRSHLSNRLVPKFPYYLQQHLVANRLNEQRLETATPPQIPKFGLDHYKHPNQYYLAIFKGPIFVCRWHRCLPQQ
eukprot:TRINITY_DN3070_c0_g1_i4.p1 TRINITY_DN3070_c0_g1~~TRINITY_DN3070_c0_g1_i4.p1  ORF type:complete len:104 (+),score=1.75 TRINITY_DN3070_c0_g1_i4:261-572(+)